MIAKGVFTVKMEPLDCSVEGREGINIGRFSLTKAFEGDLKASSNGEMTSARTGIETSAGYVAIEQVDGTLNDKSGTFVLQHHGLMSTLGKRLTVEIVPDSGTRELAGIGGTMTLDMVDGKHIYTLNYQIS